MLMRRYHRWFSFPLIIFVIAVTVTGLYLQAAEIMAEAGSSEERPLERTAPSSEQIAAAIEEAMVIAAQEQPDFPIQKVEISYRAEAPQVIVSTNRRIGPTVAVDMATGDATYVERPPRTIRTIFILLHSGKYYGAVGLWVIMLAGIALLVLSVTGIYVYYDMWRRRRKAKKTGLFWK